MHKASVQTLAHLEAEGEELEAQRKLAGYLRAGVTARERLGFTPSLPRQFLPPLPLSHSFTSKLWEKEWHVCVLLF